MIKAGYQLTITSWSNDGDNYRDITISGLTGPRVRYIIAMCKLFTSDLHGNLCETSHDAPEISLAKIDMAAVANAYLDVVDSAELEALFEEPADYMTTFLGGDEYFTFRVFESYKVHFVPKDIVDVTDAFA